MDINTQILPAATSVPDPAALAGRVVTLPIKAEAGAAVAGPAGKTVGEPDPAALKDAVAAGTKALQQLNQALEFQIDDKSKQSVVRIVDTQTREVIRQIPSVEFLRIAQNIDAFQARLLHEKA